MFHLLMLLIDGAALRLAARLGPLAPLARVGLALAALPPLALAFTPRGFLTLRLLAEGLFFHLPLLLVAGAWLDRRRRAPAAAQGVLAAALVAVYGWAFHLEPRLLERQRFPLASAQAHRAVRIAVLADLQTDRVGEHERRALQLALDAEPDLVLLTGDYLQLAAGARRDAEARRLRALFVESGLADHPRAVAVGGNVDSPDWPALFAGTRVVTCSESCRRRFPELGVTVTALSETHSRDPRLALRRPGPGLHVVAGHHPDFALGACDADLLLAGHTHGGQVRLPLIGPLLTLSRVPRRMASGRSELPGGGTLIVSRGIGMERGEAPRLRFLCRPQVVIVDVVPRRVAER